MTIKFKFEEVLSNPEAFLLALGKRESVLIQMKKESVLINGDEILYAFLEEDHIVIGISEGDEMWVFKNGVVRKHV